MSDTVLLVGCGNMGHAMLGGWLASGRLAADHVIVVEPNEALRKRASDLGVKALARADEIDLDVAATLVILAVKPQVILDVARDYVRFAEAGATTLSVAAGTGIAALQGVLGAQAPIIRCMPNTPAAIGRGMMVTVASPQVAQPVMAFVIELLSGSGEVAAIDDEALMDAVTAVSGSGPAYVFHFIECLAEAGETAGLKPETALLLARQTVFGAASLAVETGEDPAELRRQVTSPNGTTAAALNVLMGEDRLKRLLRDAVEAAKRRSIELGQ
jgi:pyrroline-5-carboxylate reductase